MSSIQELALACLFPGFEGTFAPDWVRRKAANGLGGAVLFARNVESDEQVATLTARLHGERPELVVAIDEEGGDVTRLDARTGSRYPGNLALGVAGDLRLTCRVATAMGARLAAAGIDLNLAPVADVNTNAQNPIIGVRSFGSEPVSVAEHVASWVAGMQGAGVAACVKHFPGHGDTATDSHLALPVANPELGPFKAAIAAGVRGIMSAHVVAASLDDLPATISHKVMTDLLRGELGFEGAAVTDGLEMHGLSDGRGLGEGAVLALAAGCDALCIGGELCDEGVVDEVAAAIGAAVQEGRLSQERLAEAAGRIKRLKLDQAVLESARRAVQADGDVHVGREARVIRLESPSSVAAGEVPWGIAETLAARGVRVTDSSGRVVVNVRDLHRQPDNQALVATLLARHPDAIVVEMGVPVCRPQAARAYVATHGSSRVCAEAAAELMTR